MKSQAKRPSFSLRLFKNGRLVYESTFYRKSNLLRCIQGKIFELGYLKFSYSDGLTNECQFKDFDDARAVINFFTE